jgi:osmotically-inducible protein OsmY
MILLSACESDMSSVLPKPAEILTKINRTAYLSVSLTLSETALTLVWLCFRPCMEDSVMSDMQPKNDVEPFAPAQRTDAQLRDAALEALHWKACLPTHMFEVSVHDGCVTLDGRVEWTYQKQLAERTVALLPGVTSIRDALKVSDKQTRMEVMTRIRAALRNAAETQADAIDVSVCEGTATLRGTLLMDAAHGVISSAVRSHPEVQVVRDELRVVGLQSHGTGTSGRRSST